MWQELKQEQTRLGVKDCVYQAEECELRLGTHASSLSRGSIVSPPLRIVTLSGDVILRVYHLLSSCLHGSYRISSK